MTQNIFINTVQDDLLNGRAHRLALTYQYILSLDPPMNEKTEPAADDLAQVGAAGSVGNAPVNCTDATPFYHPHKSNSLEENSDNREEAH